MLEIVIKMPEEMYKNIQSETFCLESGLTLSNAYDFIRNGTPIPKGHGRLVDADEEIQRFCGKVCGCSLEECGYGFYCPLVQRLNSAHTIIEADGIENKEHDHMTIDEFAELFTESEEKNENI